MNDHPMNALNEEETVKRMQAAYDEFVGKLEALRKERLDLARRVVARIERQKLDEVIHSLKDAV